MSIMNTRNDARHTATHRCERKVVLPIDSKGNPSKVSEFYGENIFDIATAKEIPEKSRSQLIEISTSHRPLVKELAEVVANAIVEWANKKGATHFCHWFQPLTGGTAEKHDAFLSLDRAGHPIEKLSASQLVQGEPDASSFPNGGSRSTFEARGYTTWDLTSPIFLLESANGKTIFIPTAFVSYTGDALDIKTPLLRSEVKLSDATTKFCQAIGMKDVKTVSSTCGPEQEYFLIDKAFYYSRPDLVMTGRTLFGSLSAKNQQLDDHYFGAISERVMAFMQELDIELYKLGIPSKTRHNEVAPGQYEMAPIFSETNVAADRNQLVMAMVKKVANAHNFVAILHEKPFAGINGSGKHLNWSLATDTGVNLLEPGDEPESNNRFLAVVATTVEALNRHAKMIRTSIATAGNDHRLGANEAPPSIISAYVGDTIEKIFEAIQAGKTFSPDDGDNQLDMGARQLATLMKDNTDRNRTSPFAFTGNKFELRACGSEKSIGLPLSVLNAAACEVFNEAADFINAETSAGKDVDSALLSLTKKWLDHSSAIIFNGDGYSDEWLVEAERRGLPNLKTTADALPTFNDDEATAFLVNQGVFTREELNTRYHVLLERYNTLREIEFDTLIMMVQQSVIPAVIEYKVKLSNVIRAQKETGFESSVEKEIYKRLNFAAETLFARVDNLRNGLKELPEDDYKKAKIIADQMLPLSEEIAEYCNQLEEMVPDTLWPLPKYYDMLFLR
jgi:glutamine synthetase